MSVKTGHSYFMLSSSKEVIIPDITSLRIVNIGSIPFEVCGQTFMPGNAYIFLTDGTVTDFNQVVTFADGSGAKAVVEYKQLKKPTQCDN